MGFDSAMGGMASDTNGTAIEIHGDLGSRRKVVRKLLCQKESDRIATAAAPRNVVDKAVFCAKPGHKLGKGMRVERTL